MKGENFRDMDYQIKLVNHWKERLGNPNTVMISNGIYFIRECETLLESIEKLNEIWKRISEEEKDDK